MAAPEAWDRSARRDCGEEEARLTLYCDLRRAALEEAGSFRHRRPALQIVRRQIAAARPQADYEHRLSGFNSDPSVTFQDLQRLLAASLAEAEAADRTAPGSLGSP